jgi:hypothetical protein
MLEHDHEGIGRIVWEPRHGRQPKDTGVSAARGSRAYRSEGAANRRGMSRPFGMSRCAHSKMELWGPGSTAGKVLILCVLTSAAAGALVLSIKSYLPASSSASSFAGLGGIFVIGAGSLLVGVVLMLIARWRLPAFVLCRRNPPSARATESRTPGARTPGGRSGASAAAANRTLTQTATRRDPAPGLATRRRPPTP